MKSFETKWLTGVAAVEQELRKIIRYNMYPVMYYRLNVAAHSERLRLLVSLVALDILAVYPTFDLIKAQLLARVHDHLETIIGDIQAGNKAVMNPWQRGWVTRREKAAIRQLARQYDVMIGPYRYGDLLWEAYEKKTLEAQIVSYLDEVDTYCEALHELFAGNVCFTVNVDQGHGLSPVPFQHFPPHLDRVAKKLRSVRPLRATSVVPFQSQQEVAYKKIVKQGQPHTRESVREPKGHPLYDWWIRSLLGHTPKSEHAWLWTQVEFPK